MQTKKIIEILSFVFMLVIILGIIYYAINVKTMENKVLKYNNLVFKSDKNISKILQDFRDANTIVIINSSDSKTKNIITSVDVLLLEIFGYKSKHTKTYTWYKDTNFCGFVDSNKELKDTMHTPLSECLNAKNQKEMKLILSDKYGENDEVFLDNNLVIIYVKNPYTLEKATHNFLETIYPDLSEVESHIQNYVHKVTKDKSVMNKVAK